MPESATASSTDGSSSVVATGPVCPPPSPPWTITASAPHDATFLACLAAPTDGITTAPALFSFSISSGFGASANEATLTPTRIIRSTRRSEERRVGREGRGGGAPRHGGGRVR